MDAQGIFKDFIGTNVVVQTTARSREVGKLVEIADEWVILSRVYKKVVYYTVVKSEFIVSIEQW